MQLSPNFTLEELTVSEVAARNGFDNTPNEAEIENLKRLAQLLEQVRKVVGRPVLVNSAYRSKQVNDAVGSRDTSQHRLGCAADIRVSGMTPDQVCRAIIESDIQFDQLIREFWDKEKGGGWTHISIPNSPTQTPRNQTLIIDRLGTRPFLQG